MSDVLVVDDEPEVRNLLGALISEYGVTPALAADGEEALSLIERGLRPRLVITDLRMPRLGGVELAAALNARFRDDPPAVALMSADHQWLDDVEGVVAKLPKPFSAEAIEQVITQYCMS
jgi:CheY-like chemotaxis protein